MDIKVIIISRSSNTFKSDSGSLQLAWSYYLGIIFHFCLTDQPTDRPTQFREDGGDGGGGGGGFGNLLKGKPFHVGGLTVQTSPLLLAFNPGCALILLAHALRVFGVCKLYDSAKLLQHYSTILNTALLCDVEQGGQTKSILLITPENIEKVESILQNIIAQGGTPGNKRKVDKIVKHH